MQELLGSGAFGNVYKVGGLEEAGVALGSGCGLRKWVWLKPHLYILPSGYYYLRVQILADFENSGFSGY